MVHDLKLYKENFERLTEGLKQREYRLYDEKRRLIKVGDTIRFIKLPDQNEFLYADVTNIEVFSNWYDCYKRYFDEDFSGRYNTVEDVVEDTYSGGYYTKEDTLKYGCCCISISRVRKNK